MLGSLKGEVLGVRLLTLQQVAQETALDDELAKVRGAVESGVWSEVASDFVKVKESLSIVDGVLLYGDRVVVPKGLRQEVLGTLHAGHQGETSMMCRAGHAVWWPGLGQDVRRTRERCMLCNRNAPSQQKEPPAPLPEIEYPFQRVCADYFELKGYGYLVVVDRYSGWPILHQARKASSAELVRVMKEVCTTYGVPEEISSDGGPQFVSGEFKEFCLAWGIRQRISSAYYPHSNTRAELGVKTLKRLLRDNMGPDGALYSVNFGRAILEYRNTPDHDTGRSPAQVVYGRQLRDFVPVQAGKYRPRAEWLLTMEQRELALAKRHRAKGEELSRGTKDHTPLTPGTVVLVQNQVGPSKDKWDKSGLVVADCGNSQYRVKLDGSGRITLRNRAFLKRIVPFQGRVDEPVRQEGVVLERRAGPGGFRSPQELLEPENVHEEPKIVELEVADRMPAGVAPRRSSRVVHRPARYPE